MVVAHMDHDEVLHRAMKQCTARCTERVQLAQDIIVNDIGRTCDRYKVKGHASQNLAF